MDKRRGRTPKDGSLVYRKGLRILRSFLNTCEGVIENRKVDEETVEFWWQMIERSYTEQEMAMFQKMREALQNLIHTNNE